MRMRVALLALLGAALLGAWMAGWYEQLEVARLRATVESAGWWGPALFVLLFGLEGLGVPGIFFMATAVALWPPWEAFLWNWLGAQMAGLVGFAYARTVGREWIARRLPPRMRRFEARLERGALRTVVGLRLLLFIAAPLHWALGLSPVRWRDYLLGSALGTLPGMWALSFFGAVLFGWLIDPPAAAG